MKKYYREISFFIGTFVISVFYLYFVKVGIGPINADELSGVIIGKDIFNQSNFLMKGWNLTTGITTIQLLGVTVISNLFGETYSSLYLVSALNYAILANLLAYIVFKNIKVDGIKRYIVTIVVLLLNLNPKSHSIMNVCTHTLLYAVCMLTIYIVYKIYCKKESPTIYILAGFLIGIITSTNVTMLYYALIPIIFSGLIFMWLNLGTKRRNIYLIACGITGIITSKIVYKIWIMFRGEELVFGVSEVFVTQDNIVNNIVQGISNIMYEFGIDVWGKNIISFATIKAVVGAAVLFIVFQGMIKIGKAEKDKKILIIFITTISIINIMAYVCSSLPSYSQSTHLMEPFSLFLCAAFGISIGNIDTKYMRTVKESIKLLIVICLFFILNVPRLEFNQKPSDTQPVTEFLTEKGYQKGFATYWEASTIMFDSQWDMVVAPISVDYGNPDYPEGIVGGWQWATKDEWLEQTGTFVVFHKNNPEGIHADKIIESLGSPTQYTEIDNYGILLYEDGVELSYIYR